MVNVNWLLVIVYWFLSPFATSFFALWAGRKFCQAWELIFGALRSKIHRSY